MRKAIISVLAVLCWVGVGNTVPSGDDLTSRDVTRDTLRAGDVVTQYRKAAIESLTRTWQQTTDRLQSWLDAMAEQLLERAYQQRDTVQRREFSRYLPAYCPLDRDECTAAASR